jgi:hypothetical protein
VIAQEPAEAVGAGAFGFNEITGEVHVASNKEKRRTARAKCGNRATSGTGAASERDRHLACRKGSAMSAPRRRRHVVRVLGEGSPVGLRKPQGFPGRPPSSGEPGEVSSGQLCATNTQGGFARKAALRTSGIEGCNRARFLPDGGCVIRIRREAELVQCANIVRVAGSGQVYRFSPVRQPDVRRASSAALVPRRRLAAVDHGRSGNSASSREGAISYRARSATKRELTLPSEADTVAPRTEADE